MIPDDSAPTLPAQTPRQSPTRGQSPSVRGSTAPAPTPNANRAAVGSDTEPMSQPDSGMMAHSGPTISIGLANGDANLPALDVRPPVTVMLGLDHGANVDLPDALPGTAASQATVAPRSAGGSRYTMQGEIARGGMGAILRAFDADVRREIAMKVMLGERPSSKAAARFLEEGQVTGQLEHPNIVPVYEIGVDAKQHLYFTMKLVRGRSLKEKIRELKADIVAKKGDGVFPLIARIDIFRKVCDAIAYAHSRGVIHRDLKPDNIMVGEFGEVQVMDWGLAKIIGRPETHGEQLVITDRHEDGVARTLDGEVAGTPAYMPPEQARGDLADIDERSDVYALGAILYELLTLTPPFRGANLIEILAAVSNGDLEAPANRVVSEFGINRQKETAMAPSAGTTDAGGEALGMASGRQSTIDRVQAFRARMKDNCPLSLGCIDNIPSVPRELEAIILKAMAKRRAGRYQSVRDLQADMVAYLEGRAVGAMNYAPWELLGKWAMRNKAIVTAAAMSVLILAVVGVIKLALWSNLDATTRQRAEARFSAATTAWQSAESVPFDAANPEPYFLSHLPPLMDMGGAIHAHSDPPADWRAEVAARANAMQARAEAVGDWGLAAMLAKSVGDWGAVSADESAARLTRVKTAHAANH